jgi:hypothetical protein
MVTDKTVSLPICTTISGAFSDICTVIGGSSRLKYKVFGGAIGGKGGEIGILLT